MKGKKKHIYENKNMKKRMKSTRRTNKHPHKCQINQSTLETQMNWLCVVERKTRLINIHLPKLSWIDSTQRPPAMRWVRPRHLKHRQARTRGPYELLKANQLWLYLWSQSARFWMDSHGLRSSPEGFQGRNPSNVLHGLSLPNPSPLNQGHGRPAYRRYYQ